MAATVKANVNSVAGDAVNAPTPDLPTRRSNNETFHFARTLQHYVTNNNESSQPVAASVTNTPSAGQAFTNSVYLVYNQGWFFIPFEYKWAAMTAADMDSITSSARAYRIKDAGFTIKRITATQTQASPSGSTTTITSQYVQQPSLILFKDVEHEMYSSTAAYGIGGTSVVTNAYWECDGGPGIGGTAFVPPNSAVSSPEFGFTSPNSNVPYMTNDFATSFANGRLNQVKFQIPANTTQGAPHPNSLSLLNGGEVKVLSVGDTYSYTWHNKSPIWYPCNASGLGSQSGTASTILSGSMEPYKFGQLARNLATEVVTNMIDKPHMHLVRVPPIFNLESVLVTDMELWIEYHCTVETKGGHYMLSRNRAALNTTTLANTAFTTQNDTNLGPYPVYERGLWDNILSTDAEPE